MKEPSLFKLTNDGIQNELRLLVTMNNNLLVALTENLNQLAKTTINAQLISRFD